MISTCGCAHVWYKRFVTLIALYADEAGILLLGDKLRGEENNPVPQADATKVFVAVDRKVCCALYGAVPIPDGHRGFRTDIWLADFVAQSIPRGSSALYAAVRLEHALRNPALGNRGASGGGFLVAGYEGSKPSAFEIYCESKSTTDTALKNWVVGGSPGRVLSATTSAWTS